jgi:hypothetical protein
MTMKTTSIYRTLAACALLASTAMPATAQLIDLPTPVLRAPQPLLPTTSVVTYNYTSPNVTFVWDQFPGARSLYDLLPDHFLFCLRLSTDPPCSHATALANLLPNTIPRVNLYGSGLQPIGRRYSYTPTIPDDRLDQALSWYIGGCTGPQDSTCRFAPLTRVLISTQDLRAANVSTTVNGTNYMIHGDIMNMGTRMSLPSTALLAVREVLIDPTTNACHVNPNDPMINWETNLQVITATGQVTAFSRLQRRADFSYVVPANIVGIHRPGASYQTQTLPNLTLAPSTTAVTLGPLMASITRDTTTRGYVSALYVDSSSQVQESNELNNAHAECEVIFGNAK